MADKPFRFLDLPLEIRQKIYRLKLCCFKPLKPYGLVERQYQCIQHAGFDAGKPVRTCRARHEVETAILRTSKQVYCEGFDVMVKTNRFVHVESKGIELSHLLHSMQTPVVTNDALQSSADQFPGYVLTLSLAPYRRRKIGDDLSSINWASEQHEPDDEEGFYSDKQNTPRYSLMILGRDWGRFCKLLADTDIYVDNFRTGVKLTLTINGIAGSSSLWQGETLKNLKAFFNEKTQYQLLLPFRKQLRGFKIISILGDVDEALVSSVKDEVQQRKYTSAEDFLRTMNAKKEAGNVHYREKEDEKALEEWRSAVVEIQRLKKIILWDEFKNETNSTGQTFDEATTALYSTLLCNIPQVLIPFNLRETYARLN
ncbi:hypothetical protein BDV96DRAFT_24012 [Lophiotrema nucula]|uniref:Uncharacterized protein n=1 Tax=Lophiotrema nucula TaxID=690887 RepID=A0A6A5ZFZ2_9PLEO|nr:hypothetical protein BDV96DRAFT_24012 [Lophiotrema nucula]